jgi:hypothetical protein
MPQLQVGDQAVVDVGDREVLAYVRRAGDAAAFVALNFADRPAAIRLPPGAAAAASWAVALSTHAREAGAPLPGELTLDPNEALIAIGS